MKWARVSQGLLRKTCPLTFLVAIACGESTPVTGSPAGTGGGAPPRNDASSSAQGGASSAKDAGSSAHGGGGGGATVASEASTDGFTPEASSEADAAKSAEDASDGADGASVTASCAGGEHPLCIDFEDGKVNAPWTLPAANANLKYEWSCWLIPRQTLRLMMQNKQLLGAVIVVAIFWMVGGWFGLDYFAVRQRHFHPI